MSMNIFMEDEIISKNKALEDLCEAEFNDPKDKALALSIINEIEGETLLPVPEDEDEWIEPDYWDYGTYEEQLLSQVYAWEDTNNQQPVRY